MSRRLGGYHYRVVVSSVTLPTTAPLLEEKTRLVAKRALSEHLAKSIGTAIDLWAPGAISPTSRGRRASTLGWQVPFPLDCARERRFTSACPALVLLVLVSESCQRRSAGRPSLPVT